MNRVYSRLSFMMVGVLIVSLVAACGGDDSPTATPRTTATTESAAAGTATSAEAAATATPRPAPTEAPATPTATPEPPAGPITVDALWFASDGVSVQGGTSIVRVTVREKEGTELRVGFFESEVGGSGAQWRAAGWMAVITASLILGVDPSRYEFSFDVAGRIDGPSAGALMTAAVLAGYLGDEVNPAVTMTGTINPDGTVGPVGGIPHKIEGAAASGKTIVLVPGGQRYDYDYALGQSVDLVQVGQVHGVEVKLVSDIYTVYRELTGNELPVPESHGQAALPASAFDKYRAGATGWFAKYERERSDFFALPADVQEYRFGVIDAADFYANQATQYLQEGQISAAYSSAFTAAVLARLARAAAELDDLYLDWGLDPLIDKLNASASATTQMSAVAQRIEAETPRSASDQIAIMEAFSNLSVAQGLIFQAQNAINSLLNTPEYTEDDALTAIYSANYNYVYAELYLELAQEGLGLGMGFGTAPPASLEVLTAISETLRRGAEANITYFESLIIDSWAQDYGIHPDIAKYYFQQADNEYLTAVAAIGGASVLAGTMLKPEARASVNLGAALTAYSHSASLIAKYYSLGAQIDEGGYIVGYDRQTALADMLDLADQRARAWSQAVANQDPIMSVYYYDNARLLRTGDAQEQLLALNYYWQSAIFSATLRILTNTEE
ncbi:MAG TPA: S16 family serine protease [Thermomicrobiales bacterium]|nr:S16 family serine protease [Thermomicrobiales bacterium]